MQWRLLYDENILLCVIFGTTSLCFLFNSLLFCKRKITCFCGWMCIERQKERETKVIYLSCLFVVEKICICIKQMTQKYCSALHLSLCYTEHHKLNSNWQRHTTVRKVNTILSCIFNTDNPAGLQCLLLGTTPEQNAQESMSQ